MMVFLHIPKTGGTTFQFLLENSFGISHCHTGHNRKRTFDGADFAFARKMFPWLRSIAGENIVDPLGLPIPDPFYMTFVREPVARVFSHYQDTVLRGNNRVPFEEALRANEEFENLQVKSLAGDRNLEKAKHILRNCGFVGVTEKFDLSLHLLSRLSPCRLNLYYKRKLAAQDNSVKKSLERDPRLVELTRERNALDLELYSFVTREIFPALCAKARITPSDAAGSFDRYRSEIRPKFLMNRLYNMMVYRQVCKFKERKVPRVVLPKPAP